MADMRQHWQILLQTNYSANVRLHLPRRVEPAYNASGRLPINRNGLRSRYARLGSIIRGTVLPAITRDRMEKIQLGPNARSIVSYYDALYHRGAL